VPSSGIYAASPADGPLRQGEILSDIIQLRLDVAGLASFPGVQDALPIIRVVHPLAVVISQDCDLDWDYKWRIAQKGGKEVPSVLLCETVEAQQLPNVDTGIWKRIKINKEERYQFFERVPNEHDAVQQGLPEMAVDFKRCFSIPTDELYLQLKSQAKRRCLLVSPYLEHFSQRVFCFHARVGLPAEHLSEPEQK